MVLKSQLFNTNVTEMLIYGQLWQISEKNGGVAANRFTNLKIRL